MSTNATPPGGHVFQATGTIFELVRDIIGKYLLTKFHDDQTINVASRVLTRKNATTPWRLYIIGTNYLAKFHDDRTINVASRVKNAPPPGGHVFQANVTIFELNQDIIETNLLTKFHEDWTINVASRVLKRKNAPPPWRPYIIGMNLLTKFHDDRTINVASRILTRFNYSHIRKNAPPPGGHVFQANVTIFELNQDIIETNLLTKFHEDRKINVASRVLTRKNAPPPGGHTNLLTKFHEDWTINVASRVLTRQMLTPHNARRTKGDHNSSP
ncbi:hypothetical protein DPMN_000455 [Dreissena polymorpha]|uniref:Uncharacterized protein n=1 Tax=Dreissena polymorpha TaxID=45954 RepID=A0A9D4MHD8_DREPO|nr:hypothetical protein DPMN_000455 [Dreissena polymorpha]